MVGVFRRSLSFPNKNPNRPSSSSSKPSISSYHVRSISLPCRSHPLISQLKDEINELNTTWKSKPNHHNRTSAWLCDGLSRLKLVHDSLDDLLQLPQTQESLRRCPDSVEKLLEDFLRFLDVYGIFQTSVSTLRDSHSAAQVTIRKKDESKIGLYLKSLNKMAKEMNKLVSTVGCIQRSSVVARGSGFVSNGGDDRELETVIRDVYEVTVMVSVALFNGMSSSSSSRKLSWLKLTKKTTNREKSEEGIEEFKQIGIENLINKKGGSSDEEARMMVLKRMHDLERCIGCIESCSERVFRSLINTRVSLLNVHTLERKRVIDPRKYYVNF